MMSSPAVGVKERVVVNHVSSPNFFCLMLLKNVPQLEELLKELHLTYDSSPLPADANWLQEGRFYACKLQQGVWMRGFLLEEDSTDALIFCVDYGYSKRVGVACLRPLHEKFIKNPPFQAIPCSLSLDAVVFTRKVLKHFRRLLQGEEVFRAVFERRLSCGSFQVQLGKNNYIKEQMEDFIRASQASLSSYSLNIGLPTTSLLGENAPKSSHETSNGHSERKKKSVGNGLCSSGVAQSRESPPREGVEFKKLGGGRSRQAGELDKRGSDTSGESMGSSDFRVIENKSFSGSPCKNTRKKDDCVGNNRRNADLANNLKSTKDKGSVIMKNPAELNVGDTVCVTAVESLHSFYVTLDSSKEDFCRMMRALKEYMSGLTEDDDEVQVGLGSYVVAKRNKVWSRGRVEEVLGRAAFQVFFVDFGNSSRVTECFPLPESCRWMPRNALHCSLLIVRQLADVEENLEFFIKNILNTTQTVFGVGHDGQHEVDFRVDLIEEKAEHSLVEMMMQRSEKNPVALKHGSKENSKRHSSIEDVSPMHRSDGRTSPTGKRGKNHSDHSVHSPLQSLLRANDCVRLVYIEGVHLFHIHFQHTHTTHMPALNDALLDHCGNERAPSQAPVEGVVLAALFEEEWSRALVLKKHSNNKLRVKFTDFGNVSTVALADVRLLPTQLIQLPPSPVLACRLAGVDDSQRRTKGGGGERVEAGRGSDGDAARDEWFKVNCEYQTYVLQSFKEVCPDEREGGDDDALVEVELYCPDRRQTLAEWMEEGLGGGGGRGKSEKEVVKEPKRRDWSKETSSDDDDDRRASKTYNNNEKVNKMNGQECNERKESRTLASSGGSCSSRRSGSRQASVASSSRDSGNDALSRNVGLVRKGGRRGRSGGVKGDSDRDKSSDNDVPIKESRGDNAFVRKAASREEEEEEPVKRVFRSELPEMEVGEEEVLCEVMSPSTPSAFWCQDLKQMVKLFQLIAPSAPPGHSTHLPREGEVCLGYHEGFEDWYRMVVEEVKDRMASVDLIDYADHHTVPFSHLLPLPPLLATFPPLAFQCSLKGFKEPGSESMKEELNKKFVSLVENQRSWAKIEKVESRLLVSLHNQDGLNVAHELEF